MKYKVGDRDRDTDCMIDELNKLKERINQNNALNEKEKKLINSLLSTYGTFNILIS